MTWKQIAHVHSGPITQQSFRFVLSHDVGGFPVVWPSGTPKGYTALPLTYCYVQIGEFACADTIDEAAVNQGIDDEIARLFKANPVCTFDGQPFFGRHCIDPGDPVSATWSNEVVCDETWTEDFRRFKLREALRNAPWARGQTNSDLPPPVFFSADGYTYAVAPPSSPLQAAVLVTEPVYTARSAWLGVGLGLPHMVMRAKSKV
jgi:hypothetical protein